MSIDGSERDDKYAQLQEIGADAARALAEMVAALECDYDRLEELRAEFMANDLGLTAEEWGETDSGKEKSQLETLAGECSNREEAEERIQEDPLEIVVRGDWVGFGTEPVDAARPVEFRILLTTGGPAVRICGELDNGEVAKAWIEAQDWFQPWTEYRGDAISMDDLLTYCRCFSFDEGG